MAGLGTTDILNVWPDKFKGDEERQKQLDSLGLTSHSVSPTLFSAFTSMTIATECDRRNARLVHTYRPLDAMAAISARRIAKRRDFSVVLEFADNAPRPRSISKDILKGVDAWVLPTDRLADMAAASHKPCLVMLPKSAETDGRPLPAAGDKPHHLLWAGPLEKNIERLKDAIRLVGNSDGRVRLTVLGTGTARYAMQAVKLSRALPDPSLVQWLGDNYSPDRILPEATAIVQSQDDPTPYELDIASGRCLCRATDGGFVLSAYQPICARERAQRLYDFYRQLWRTR